MQGSRLILILISLVIAINRNYTQHFNLDSLELLLRMADHDRDRVDELNVWSSSYEKIDFSLSKKLAQRALAIAQGIDYELGIFDSYNNLGLAYDYLGETDTAIYYYDEALKLAIEFDDPDCKATAKNNLGVYYLFKGNYPLALQYLQEAMIDNEEAGYEVDHVYILNNIGVIHEAMGDKPNAIRYFKLCAEEAEKREQPQYKAYACLSWGYIACLESDYERALPFYKRALGIYNSIETRLWVAETSYYLIDVYQHLHQPDSAMSFAHKALEIYKEAGSLSDVCSMYANIAELHRENGDTNRAIEMYQKAADLATEGELPVDMIEIMQGLANIYAEKGDFETAFSYQKQYKELNDTINQAEAVERIQQMELLYQLKMQNIANEKLEAENSIREAVLQKRTIVAIASSLIAILIAIIALIYYWANKEKAILNQNLERMVAERTEQLQSTNSKLRDSNEELERFTHIASHDLKEPLRNITSFVNLMQRKLKDYPGEEVKEYMEFVTRNSRQMYELLEDMLAYSRITGIKIDDKEELDVNEVVQNIEYGLKVALEEKNAVIQASELPNVKAHKAHFYLVLKNLIENGLKYNVSSCPTIHIDYQANDQGYQFRVQDNGIGIDPEYHEQVFEMFKRLNNRNEYKGSGIGLATCKKILQKYGGEIWVDSAEGRGSTFYFTFPNNSS